jgi:hypothetical protein
MTGTLSRSRILVSGAFLAVSLRAWDTTPALTLEQQENFLKTAKVTASKSAKKGVTDTLRVTLSDGKMTHDASVQRIHDYRTQFQGQSGGVELNFKDTYEFNIAAWKLAKLLGLQDMMPPSVDRKYAGQAASFTWWIDDVLMDEQDRLAKKIQAPDQDHWARELNVMHVFDQLIYNTDSNATNLLIDTKWQIWMIDHSRSFRLQKTLENPKMLNQCDRALLAKMKTLDEPTLVKELKGYANGAEVKALLARRDLIVKFFEQKGDGALFDRPARQ